MQVLYHRHHVGRKSLLVKIFSCWEILNHEKYKKGIHNLPDDFIEYEIDGGCHAYFGAYGEQDGDGTPSISVYNQISETSSYITALIYYHSAYED